MRRLWGEPCWVCRLRRGVRLSEAGSRSEPTLPFDLGGSFSVLASGNAAWPGLRGADGGATVNFALFEADGTTPVFFVPVSAPEPSPRGLLLFGLTLAGGSLLHRFLLTNRSLLTKTSIKNS